MGEESKIRKITLTIYGEPVPQGRPKFARVGNRVITYDPPKSQTYKNIVKLWATNQLKRINGFKMFDSAICVDVTFYLRIPPSWPKKKRIEAECGAMRPIKKPDLDNLYKSLTDALTGIVWKDDSIITDASIHKRYTADTERAEITIREAV